MRPALTLLLLSLLGFLTMGYHPGAEDDGVYLTAVKSDLHPALYPHNAEFFRAELKTTCFDTCLAAFVRATRIPLAWAALLWTFVSIYGVLSGCWLIARRLFDSPAAHWGAAAALAAMFTLPVSGTGLYIVDQYLHPRALATALILLAVSRILDDKVWHAVPLLCGAILLHPIMGLLGTGFCCISAVALSDSVANRIPQLAETPMSFALIPFGWLFYRPRGVWLQTLDTRHWFCLYSWTWYEWLGALAPLVIFWLVGRAARLRGEVLLSRFALAIVIYGTLFLCASMIVLAPNVSSGLGTLEPMRFLHLIYIFLAIFAGAWLGQQILRARFGRWALFLLVFNGSMFLVQRHLFAATEHLELPGRASHNPWLRAFAWVRANTPPDACFALDPNYMAEPGEDYHSFRALAERSALSDAIKDASVVTKVPEAGAVWQAQQDAQSGWSNFQLKDFERLRAQFGVNWVIVSQPAAQGLDCPWNDPALAVCRVP